MPPFEKGESGTTSLLDLQQLSTALEAEPDLYPSVVIDIEHKEATLVLLAFERATHNVPESAQIPPEQIATAREEIRQGIDASIVMRGKIGVLAAMRTSSETVTDRPAGTTPDSTGLQYIPGFMEASRKVKPETPKRMERRVHRELSKAVRHCLLSPESLEVAVLGLANEAKVGDRNAVTPNEIAASKIESDFFCRDITRQLIELPAGENFTLRITFPDIP